MAITQTVDIPSSHRLVIDVPREVPEGKTVLIFKPASEQESAEEDVFDEDGYCPLCAPYRDPESGRLIPNAETIAAIEEGRAMMRGEIPSKLYNSAEEMWADLDRDDDDD